MDEKQIWQFFIKQGLSKAGVSGVMGNLYAESKLKFDAIEISRLKKIGMTSQQYIYNVDNNLYNNFIKDSIGTGIYQITFWTRKKAFYNLCKSRGVSIADPMTQLEFLMAELKTYKVLFKTLQTTTSVRVASDMFLTTFEKPKDQSQKVKDLRYSYSMNYYNKYSTENQIKTESQPFINKEYPCNKSNYGGKRTSIEWIVVHYTGNKTDTALANVKYFQGANRGASAHYFCDQTSIYQSVPDDCVAWAVGKKYGNAKYWGLCKNQNSISIECCSNNGQITETTQNKAIELINFLMKKYNIDKNHVIRHMDCTAKRCPGWTLDTDQGWYGFLNKLSNNSPSSKKVLYKVQVTSKSPLNIRSGPGTDFIPIGQLNNGDVVEVCEEKNGFLRLNGVDKWISSKYVKEVN